MKAPLLSPIVPPRHTMPELHAWSRIMPMTRLGFRALMCALLLVALIEARRPAVFALESASPANEPPKQALLVYGDRSNAIAFATLLFDVDLKCRMRSQRAYLDNPEFDGDLVVFLACCRGGWRQPPVWNDAALDRLGDARLLACGNAGASLLETKKLLIGHPNGAHWRGSLVTSVVENISLYPGAGTLLDEPRDIAGPMRDGSPVVIQNSDAVGEHIGIFDGGTFPRGTTGLARMGREAHHWLIAKQGNYAFWGVDAHARDLTDDGQRLFANLCWQLANAPPAPLIFPEKQFIDRPRSAKLVGGGRDISYYALRRTGRIVLRLQWRHAAEMMLMTHDAHNQRADGRSPLEITFHVGDAMVGKELSIEVGSFQLREGEECPFELSVEWDG